MHNDEKPITKFNNITKCAHDIQINIYVNNYSDPSTNL